MTAAHFRQSKIKLKRGCFIQRELSNSGSDKELGPFSILRSVMLLKQSDFFYILSFDAVDAVNLECDTRPGGKALGIKRCCQGGQMNAFLQFCGRLSGDS